MDVPYRLSEGYGEKTLYVQVKNNYSESNVRRIGVNFKDPYVPLVLRNAYINNDDASTYSPEVLVMADKEGIPTHYRIGENADLSLLEWVVWPDPKSSVIPFTLSPEGGQKTVYLQLKGQHYRVRHKSGHDQLYRLEFRRSDTGSGIAAGG